MRHVFLAATVVATANAACSGSRFWPLPTTCTFGSSEITLPTACSSLGIALTPETSSPATSVVKNALGRLQQALFNQTCPFAAPLAGTVQLYVSITGDASTWPPKRPGALDESYTIAVESGSLNVSAPTAAGVLHGLTTLLQLMERQGASSSPATVQGVPVTVQDSPRYHHRGVMLDTARHFLPLPALMRTIDGLAASRMNALHLHLVDAESFPLVVPSLPRLASAGAFSPTATYSASDLQSLQSYAADRGVVVIPEVDVPGHAYAWGLGYPNATANCPGYEHNINNIPLNPSVRFAFDALQSVIGVLAKVFPGELVHIGGDEVVLGCWGEDEGVQRLMRENGWTSLTQVLQYFVTQADGIVRAAGKVPVHWQDLYDDGVTVDSQAVMQVWRSQQDTAPLAAAGHDVVVSAQASGWYLNCGFNPSCPYSSWQQVYAVDIEEGVVPADRQRVVGGEAVMFGEFADANALDPQLWPRAAAVGERLWVPASVNDTTAALPRITLHACRMQALGLASAPVGPGYCDPTTFVVLS